MPLPTDISLSVLPHTNPGESGHSRPKQAMIVRMTSETLDALQNAGEPSLDFDFGNVPGIHIGSAFFPMRPLKEEAPHELYLRTTSATKQPAPLKHYANVTGKFTIDPSLNSVADRLRENTIDAAKQKDRKTIFMDVPPPRPPSTGPKRKKEKDHASALFRNVVRQADQAKFNASMSAASSRASPVPPKPKANDSSASTKKRLIHYLAVSERTQDTVVKMVAGPDCDSAARTQLLQLLEEVGELTSPLKRGEDPAIKVWRLKTEAWKEVRPLEWPKLSEKSRLAMARTGRQKLASLGISESDPIWANFKYRGPIQNTPVEASSSNAEVPPKRGVSTKEVKEKRTKPKNDIDMDPQIKDESARIASSKGKELDAHPALLAKLSGSGRKLPGSGYKMGKTPPTGPESLGSANTTSAKLVDVRSSSTSSLPQKPPPLTTSSATQNKKSGAPQRVRKVKDSDSVAAGADSERERERAIERAKEKGKSRVVREQMEEERVDARESSTLQKRKQLAQYDDESDAIPSKSSPLKKRKAETVSIPVTQPSKARDLSLPKKPDLGPPPRAKHKEPSPLPSQSPLPKIKKEQSTETKLTPPSRGRDRDRDHDREEKRACSPDQNKQDVVKAYGGSSATKLRRKSPVYTSSSDEGENCRLKRESPSRMLPTPPSNDSAASAPSSFTQSQPRQRQREREKDLKMASPNDHAVMRARYKVMYGKYLEVYHQMYTQRGKIQTLLERGENGYGSAAESDVGDLMDSDSLSRLNGEYQRLHGELRAMREKFGEV